MLIDCQRKSKSARLDTRAPLPLEYSLPLKQIRVSCGDALTILKTFPLADKKKARIAAGLNLIGWETRIRT
jgi:hypothetical protein